MTTDGEGLASHAGTGLLAEMADRSGLTEAMSVAMGDCGISWHTHDPGVVLTHMAVAIADGADCLSHLRVLRNQEELFGPVASQATAWRAVQAVTSVELRAIEVARATARALVWAAGAAPASVTLDFDATLVDAHSEKQDAAATYKRGFGFHPLGVWCDETGEALASRLRPGNAGANDSADHVKVLDAALSQLPPEWQAGHREGDEPAAVVHPILARADSAGATHGFVDALVERNIAYSIGFDVDARVRAALMLAQEEDWVPAVEADGTRRPGAWVIELTDLADLTTWPEGARLVCRRERPHPGAQLSLFDIGEGFRHTCFITGSPGAVNILELRQRGHARVEDRIRAAKDCGLRNLPFEDFVRNEAWLVLVTVAQDLLAWTAGVCLQGAMAKAEPATLRY
ncbi:MAG: IS1380 family transposase, partial [Actinomycetes bacterium]